MSRFDDALTDRHPEKSHRKDAYHNQQKPDWLKVAAPVGEVFKSIRSDLREKGLHSVCDEAMCPNIGECWKKGHVTVMVLGERCTRGCNFCAVATGKPDPLDPFEPEKVAQFAKKMACNHIVITSVNRDDLPDGGAQHFARVVKCVREARPESTVEILTPDFLRKANVERIIADAAPDVFNHNLETVPRLYNAVRPGANYFSSLNLLKKVKELNPSLFTKSGLMVGLGEEKHEVLQVMDDMRAAEVDFITIGQYLQPSPKHYKMDRFIEKHEYKEYEQFACSKGFLMVSASPLTRSSYHADEDFKKLKENRKKRQHEKNC